MMKSTCADVESGIFRKKNSFPRIFEVEQKLLWILQMMENNDFFSAVAITSGFIIIRC